MARTFIDAGAQSTSPGAITAAQTTLTLASTANFGSPSVTAPTSVVILDSGNPAWNPAFPLATPFEYQLITNNNTGTNVLTINSGTRSGYAGTTPKSFFAGATIAAVLLAEDLAVVTNQNPFHAEVYQGGIQTFGSGVPGTVAFDTIEGDPNGNYSTSTHNYTTPVAGRYLVAGAVQWASACTSRLDIFVNNVVRKQGDQPNITQFIIVVAAMVRCNAGDTINLGAIQTSGVNINTSPGQAVVYASFTYMGLL